MNQEIYEIIKDMIPRCKTNCIAESDKQTYLMVQSSRLSVLLAEEEIKRSEQMAEQTDKIIKLTRIITYLTYAMAAIAFVQVVIALTSCH